jgi:hypothetical protein
LREASRTKFENLNTEQAGKVAGEAFPGLVNTPAGGPPRLPTGQKIVGFPSDSIAQVDLGGGKRGVIEATEPMAVQSSSGQRTPIDLSLSQVGNVFEPATPAVGVSIPQRLSAGVQLPVLNVSLTPVDAHGSPLGGSEGALTGAGVMYANTQTDSDTLVKPTTGGFEADTLLRSVESLFSCGVAGRRKPCAVPNCSRACQGDRGRCRGRDDPTAERDGCRGRFCARVDERKR